MLRRVISAVQTTGSKTINFLVVCLLIGYSAASSSAVVWSGAYKVLEVITNVNGDLFIVLNAPAPPVPGCPSVSAVVIPKTVPVANLVVSDSVLARMQALAQSAKAQNANVFFAIETNYSCLWGVYPIAIQMQEAR
jgi:hypothetical protein